MAGLLEVRLYPDPVLRERGKEVLEWDPQIEDLIKNMAEMMYDRNGVGLAAPQIGVNLRVIVADIGEGLMGIVNPRVVEREGEEDMQEGCLSVPGARVDVTRTKSILVKGLDARGQELVLRAEDLLARVIQHEIDHLDGILIVDRLPREERLKFDMDYSREAASVELPPPARLL